MTKRTGPPTPTVGGDYVHTRHGLKRRDELTEQVGGPGVPVANLPESATPAGAKRLPVRKRKTKE